jgi:hypothetical protein
MSDEQKLSVKAIRDQFADLKQRINALEKAEIHLRAVAVGPRGAQGQPGPFGEAGPKGDQGDRGARGTDGKDGKDGADGHTLTHEELDSLIQQILIEYHVLDANALPYSGPYAASNIPTKTETEKS